MKSPLVSVRSIRQKHADRCEVCRDLGVVFNVTLVFADGEYQHRRLCAKDRTGVISAAIRKHGAATEAAVA